MFKVIETFSGIGAQAKALERAGIKHKIINTCDWDINAIIAYCRIHCGEIDRDKYRRVSDERIDSFLRNLTLSADGKQVMSEMTYNRLDTDFKRILYTAIKQSKNLVSITDVSGSDICEDIDLFTYSFPCQDLSLCGCWHGNKSGIARDAHNRSGMLWEVERILKEMHQEKRRLPHFLVMENVTNILSAAHRDDFEDWQHTLEELGYYNKIYRLNARYFGVPQKRERAYMISILCNGKDAYLNTIDKYFEDNNLEDPIVAEKYSERKFYLRDVLKLNYNDPRIKEEADANQPNDTPSRQKIFEENDILFNGKSINEIYVNTITTKQDRNPNSGLIKYSNRKRGKARWRYLLPRECFMLMGFDEKDYEKVVIDNLEYLPGKKLFTNEKMMRMAGNSICVDVLEAIFKQIKELDKLLYQNKRKRCGGTNPL